jgi:hypothetical protein
MKINMFIPLVALYSERTRVRRNESSIALQLCGLKYFTKTSTHKKARLDGGL